MVFVVKQISLVEKVQDIQEDDGVYRVKTSEGMKTVSVGDCECIFRRSMKLPCRHMFALRKKLGVSLFDDRCCAERWTVGYYRATQRIFCDMPSTTSIDVSFLDFPKQRKLTQHEKFRKANMLTTELAAVVSEASHTHFYRRLELLKDLIDSWKSGTEVALADLDSGENYCICASNVISLFFAHRFIR